MKKIMVFIFIIFTVTNLYAQDKITDSLKLALRKEETDTNKVNILVRISNMYSHGSMIKNNDSSWKYANQASDLSQRIGYVKGERAARFAMAGYFLETGNYPEALKASLKNIKDIERSGSFKELYYQSRLLNWIYNSIGDNKMALQYAEKLREMANSAALKDSGTESSYGQIAYLNLSNTYFNLNQQDSGLYYLSLLYKNALKDNEAQDIALATHLMADYYSRIRKDSVAFSFFRKCIFYAKKSNRIDLVADSKFGMAWLFYEQKQSDSSFFYARQALQDVKSIDVPDVSSHVYHLLSDLYKSRHQYDSAYKYLSFYTALQDSLNNQNKITQAQNLSFNETLHQQQLEQAQKEAQQQYATKIKFYILAAIIAVFLTIAFLLLRNNRNKRKANELLLKKNEEIESQRDSLETTLSDLKSTQKQLIQSEKMASLGELTAGIAHEIQNPLNFVNNFSDVNKELLAEMKDEMDKGNADDAKAIANDVIENEEKINHHGKRADAIVKGMLQHSRVSSGVKEPTDINALCDEYLRLSYHGLRAKDKSFNAILKTDFDEHIGKINIVAQDIGRVILNLINNAFYACNERSRASTSSAGHSYEPTVSVTTKRSENHVIITVSDNGNGIPEKIIDKIFQPFFTTKPTGQGTGLGLSLSYDIIKAAGGEIKVETKEGDGSEFTIILPDKTN